MTVLPYQSVIKYMIQYYLLRFQFKGLKISRSPCIIHIMIL